MDTIVTKILENVCKVTTFHSSGKCLCGMCLTSHDYKATSPVSYF